MKENYKNVFVSHYGKDNEYIEKLKALVGKKGYTLRDSSSSSQENNANDPDYIKYNILKPGIDWAGQLIVLIGPETHKRDMVDWEIDQAHKQGMKIIGIHLDGTKETNELPEKFKDFGTAETGWTSDNIIDALEGRYNEFRNSQDQQREPIWDANRGDC